MWKQLIEKAAQRVGQVINHYRQRNAAKQKTMPEPKQKNESVPQQEKPLTDKAKEQATQMKKELQENNLLQKGKEVKDHDGSIPQNYGNGSSGNQGSSDYNPERGRSLSPADKSKDGLSL